MKNYTKKNIKKVWSIGDSKKDRKGRLIYFIGYSRDLDAKGNPFELWQLKPILNKPLDTL
ncbi:hypothetical protein N9Q90_04440 [Gammaproteobacteria bacterium]|nr:hypothetical protein [Gammaproteobacteria bacterium]MDA9321344.1 hypothetical protein [Gammaproteobacteria bacterium]MDB4157230.1 hypothetical protein [Gammaproteobacteria bacterium]MDC0005504.1 hypothetical protein [Gammaproteobacteria bacterium]